MSFLSTIIEYKRDEVRLAKANTPISALESLAQEIKPRGFLRALETRAATGFALIAEIKKASPSKGLIRADFDPAHHAKAYQAGGASCLSVLTDGPSFQGDLDYLMLARNASTLPILRKDFTIDPYQVVEARARGADCILLIMACLSDAQAAELESVAEEMALDILVETHNANEMERAINLNTKLIGVNNRNLSTFHTDLGVTAQLSPQIPTDRFLVSESGIHSHDDMEVLRGHGAKGFLVGESLMREKDLENATKLLLGQATIA